MTTMTPQERRRRESEIRSLERALAMTRKAQAALRERFPGRYPEPQDRKAS
jgi:hypothetical protein